MTSLVDSDRIAAGQSRADAKRRRQLAQLLAAKEQSVELAIVARCATILLGQIANDDALDLLKEFVDRDPDGKLGRMASTALNHATKQNQPVPP